MREWFDLFSKWWRENIKNYWWVFWTYFWNCVLKMIVIDTLDMLEWKITWRYKFRFNKFVKFK